MEQIKIVLHVGYRDYETLPSLFINVNISILDVVNFMTVRVSGGDGIRMTDIEIYTFEDTAVAIFKTGLTPVPYRGGFYVSQTPYIPENNEFIQVKVNPKYRWLR